MVFQNYALYPHMTVEENITYGLRTKKFRGEKLKKINRNSRIFTIDAFVKRKPKELSGGQRQRVALARAVVKESEFFLLDEPLSNLDAQLRVSARQSLMEIHEKFKQTMVYVTHDQIEAMTFGQRIALLNKGTIQMFDTPENVYHRPANIFTAKFIGNPPTNILENVQYKNGAINFGDQVWKLTPEWIEQINNNSATEIVFGIRPEHIQLFSEETANSIRGKVRYTENQGSNYAVYIQVEGEELIVLQDHNIFKKTKMFICSPLWIKSIYLIKLRQRILDIQKMFLKRKKSRVALYIDSRKIHYFYSITF
ncbi:ABC transporter ATP-binding protein [Bacillus sp. N9]